MLFLSLMSRFTHTPCLFLLLYLGASLPSLGQTISHDWLQGAWESDHPMIKELRVDTDGTNWYVDARGEQDNRIIHWERAYLQALTSSSENVEADMSATLLAARGQLTITFGREGQNLIAHAVFTHFTRGEAQRDEHEILLQRTGERNLQAKSVHIPSQSTGNVEATITGPASSVASIFHASLYGPNEPSFFVSTQSLRPFVSFENLEPGIYWLVVEARGSSGVQAFPDRQRLLIEQGEITACTIELR